MSDTGNDKNYREHAAGKCRRGPAASSQVDSLEIEVARSFRHWINFAVSKNAMINLSDANEPAGHWST